MPTVIRLPAIPLPAPPICRNYVAKTTVFWIFTIMTEPFNPALESTEVPVALRRTASMLSKLSWANIWAQGILAVLGALPIIFAMGRNMVSQTPSGASRAAGLNGAGVILLLSLVVQLYVMLRSFQCVRMARQLKSADPARRPSKASTIGFLWQGVVISLAGLGLALLANEAISGILVGRSMASFAPGAVYNPGLAMQVIEPLDLGMALGAAQILCAHTLGLTASLWMLSRIDR
jgi:Protein of unknown function (DUF3611)